MVSRSGSMPSGSDSVFGSYIQFPPIRVFCSKTTTLWCSRFSSRAVMRPDTPAPITATFTERFIGILVLIK